MTIGDEWNFDLLPSDLLMKEEGSLLCISLTPVDDAAQPNSGPMIIHFQTIGAIHLFLGCVVNNLGITQEDSG